MRRMTPARFPETLAFLMRRRALRRIGAIGALAFSQQIHSTSYPYRRQRIVCIGGALTEIIFEMGAQSCLVGVDTTSSFPKEASLIAQVGYARSLSAEGILALAPTSVIATEEAGPPGVLRQISASGVAVEVLDSGYRYEGLIQRIVQLGHLLSFESEAVSLIERLNLEWNQLHASTLADGAIVTTPRRVLFLFAHSSSRLMAAGTQTGAHAMIEYAGAINASSEYSGYRPLTPESLVSARPDILLMTDHGFRALGELSAVLKLPGVMQTPAGQQQQIIKMDASLLLGFGPRLPIAVKRLKSQFKDAVDS
jgi:iron complex transport system substrate-binding protein